MFNKKLLEQPLTAFICTTEEQFRSLASWIEKEYNISRNWTSIEGVLRHHSVPTINNPLAIRIGSSKCEWYCATVSFYIEIDYKLLPFQALTSIYSSKRIPNA